MQVSLGLVWHLGIGSAHMLHSCSLEMEYSLHGHTTWYGRQPFMTWMWSPAGSTRPLAARTEIFGGHPLLRPSDHIPFCLRGSAVGSSVPSSICPGLCIPLSLQNEYLSHLKGDSPFGVGEWLPERTGLGVDAGVSFPQVCSILAFSSCE